MDRELSTSTIQQRSRRRWLLIVAIAAGLALSLWALRRFVSTTISRSEIRTATVETGRVENTLSASGEILPQYEQVITSPITAVLQQVYLEEGSTVKPGDRILELDKEFTRIEFEKQRDQLDMKRNSILKLQLELDKSFFDLKIQDSIKACQISSLQGAVENCRRLFRAGGGTREAIEVAENNLRIARLEKQQLEYDLKTRQQVMQTSLRETGIAASIQEKDLHEFERKLQQADIAANRAGVLTYVNKNLGAKVGEGEALARIADLGSFRVQGSISDNYSGQLSSGMEALIRINDSILTGMLTNIHPSVDNNIITFDVALRPGQALEKLLRPKMKVEVYLVTDRRPNTLRVANGAAFRNSGRQDVFVLRPDGVLERRTIGVGLTSFDYVEITDGLSAGETVVISDLSRFRHLKEIKLK